MLTPNYPDILQTLMQVNFNKFCTFAIRMKEQEQKSEWFEDWFNTPYYHILYKNRNYEEAEFFMRNLVAYLQITPAHKVLDLACGKGRHAIFLNKLGLDVTGADLSPNSIAEAGKSENKRLHFLVHDMREAIPGAHFDFIVNLFTSFGYFDTQEDNQQVLNAIHQMLVPGGKLVIDFFNVEKVVRNMVPAEHKNIEGIDFHIEKHWDGTHIYKKISFEDNGESFSFTERVQGLRLSDFQRLLLKSDFEITDTFGDLHLHPFDIHESDRLIIIATKRS